ncbi:hypothetical protein RYA07_25890, partial [Pseudomonas syringae pv. actinidiae]|nr:hypothetical protein [Pseudomonas syringae pv. actinidiae]
MTDQKGRSPQDGNPNGLLYGSAKERMQESYSAAPKTERPAESDEVLVSANHPTLGPLYWVYTSNADCNYPDHYTITDWSEVATRFPHYWREHEHLHWVYRGHIGVGSGWGRNDTLRGGLRIRKKSSAKCKALQSKWPDPAIIGFFDR